MMCQVGAPFLLRRGSLPRCNLSFGNEHPRLWRGVGLRAPSHVCTDVQKPRSELHRGHEVHGLWPRSVSDELWSSSLKLSNPLRPSVALRARVQESAKEHAGDSYRTTRFKLGFNRHLWLFESGLTLQDGRIIAEWRRRTFG